MGPTSVVLHFRPSVNRENGFKLGDQHHVVIIYIYIYISIKGEGDTALEAEAQLYSYIA